MHLVPPGDLDRIAAGTDRFWIGDGLAGADVEFPAVPGAAQDFAAAGVFVGAGLGGFDQAGGQAEAQTAALVRAAIEQAEILAVEVEDADACGRGR